MMIRFFVKNPITTIMFVLFFMVLGVVSFFNLQVEKNPKIEFPIVTVTVPYPGATPLEVETSVIKKMEDAVAQLSEIEKIRSESYDNFGFLYVEFLLSADINVKFIEVKDKVEALLNDFPTEVKKPIIEKFDPLILPVMTLVLSSDTIDEVELYELADKKIKDRFAAVKGVANIELVGGRERQINVILDPLLMQKHYIDIRDVVQSLAMKNKNIPGGLLEKEHHALNLRFVGEFERVEDIAEMLIVSRDGNSVALKEIAIVEDGAKKLENIARYQGKNVVALSLQKVSDDKATVFL
jgi:hydrophobic/amphiphilic exporter-1 (mainly G- bacteria), HAE1 family